MPVFDEQGELLFFTAARAHHADIGGITPGSMPPDKHPYRPGRRPVRQVQIVGKGRLPGRGGARRFASGPCPVCNMTQSVADLLAQVAVVPARANELQAMVGQFGSRWCGPIWAMSRTTPRKAVRRVLDGAEGRRVPATSTTTARPWDRPDQPSTSRARTAHVDFTGTSPAAAEQLQRTGGGDAGGGALRVPDPGGREHPDERGLPGSRSGSPFPKADPSTRYPAAAVSPATSRPASG